MPVFGLAEKASLRFCTTASNVLFSVLPLVMTLKRSSENGSLRTSFASMLDACASSAWPRAYVTVLKLLLQESLTHRDII